MPFITYREQDADGNLQYYILQKKFPHVVSVLLTYPPEDTIGYSPIPGYYLWVGFEGTLTGRFIPMYRNILPEINSVLNEMAEWFHSERILKNEKKYKKFKIVKDDTSLV